MDGPKRTAQTDMQMKRPRNAVAHGFAAFIVFASKEISGHDGLIQTIHHARSAWVTSFLSLDRLLVDHPVDARMADAEGLGNLHVARALSSLVDSPGGG
jgi:hypothetical protein